MEMYFLTFKICGYLKNKPFKEYFKYIFDVVDSIWTNLPWNMMLNLELHNDL